jgi:adenylosuccinate synthase
LEKIGRTQEGEGRALADKVSRVIVEHMGLRLMKPTKAEAARIDRVVKRNNRNKSWVSDEEARPEIYKR